MATFAKLFEVEGEQVLFFREPDNDGDFPDDREMIHQMVNIGGVFADVKLCGFTIENSDKAWAKIDQEAADNLVKSVRGLLAGK